MTHREIIASKPQEKPLFSHSRLLHGFYIACLAGVFIGFLAPFGMDEIPLIHSVGFWVITCVSGYLIYMPCINYGERLLNHSVWFNWQRVAISAFVASVLMSFMVPFISWLFFSIELNYSKQLWSVFPKTLLIGGVITFISMMQRHFTQQNRELTAEKSLNKSYQQTITKQSVQQNNQQFNKFMAMIPIDKRGELYCLEMSDHYVKVYTSAGHHLLLMRFKDALELLAEYPGLQTHRSWWVAKEAIIGVQKEGRKISLMLAHDIEVPVSRTYAEAVKSADIH